jgi:sugar (pentulose or hexulose) kinase
MFNLRMGSKVLDEQGYPRTELVLTGGLTNTPQLAQVLADVFDTPVKLLVHAAEGTAWGAALLAKFRCEKIKDGSLDWADFLSTQTAGDYRLFQPDAAATATYEIVFRNYEELMRKSAKFLAN